MDGEEHCRRRGIVNAGFTVRRVKDREPFLRPDVGELYRLRLRAGPVRHRERHRHAAPDGDDRGIIGLPEADHAQLLHWSDLFATGGSEVRDQVVQAVGDSRVHPRAVAHRRRGTGEDLVSLVVHADDERAGSTTWT